jgi:hypothetical protein
MARLKEFPDQSTADSTTKTVFSLIAPICEVDQMVAEQPFLKYFYALGSGPRSFKFSKYKQINENCELQIDRFQVTPLTKSKVTFILVDDGI